MKISPVVIISTGLVALTLGILVIADMLGIIPNEKQAQLQARIQLSEALAVQFSVSAQNNDFTTIQHTLDAMVERNKHILSAGLRNAAGDILTSSGDHPSEAAIKSTPDFIKIPLHKNNAVWIIVEIRFNSLGYQGVLGFLKSSYFRLLLFVAVLGFIIYMLLMRKVLRHLDPFSIVPARVRAVMNAMSEGVCLIDKYDNIVLVNDAFENKVGRDLSELSRIKLSSMRWLTTNHESCDSTKLPWSALLTGLKNITHVELKYLASDKAIKTFIVNGTAIRDSSNKLRGALVTFDDVTELEKKNRLLEKQQEVEQQRIQWLEGMASILRHEMNTALLGAASSVMLLQNSEKLDEENMHLVALAAKSHGIIKELLDNVTQATSIESAFLKEDKTPVCLTKLFNEHLQNYKLIYPDNDILFIARDGELIVNGQEERFIQLLDKLVSNAVEHTLNYAPIVITCSKDRNEATISVVNQGDPIDENNDAIFDLFASFKSNNNASNKGIGLYVVKMIAEGYGGSVSVANKLEEASVEFVIKIPESM